MAPALPYADLCFKASAEDGPPLPGFPGPTLRGALGLALRRLACHARRQECDRCLVAARCAYSVIFEGVPPADRRIMRKYPRVPQPFLFLLAGPPGPGRLPAPGRPPDRSAAEGALAFGVRLFGPAVAMYPYVVEAVRQMLGRGLGRDRRPFTLQEVTDGREVLYREGDTSLRPPRTRLLRFGAEGPPASGGGTVEVRCLTPLRLQVDGRVARRLALGPLLRAVLRRARVLAAFYGRGDGDIETPSALLDAAEAAVCTAAEVGWRRIRRYSTRQRRRMTLAGLTGWARFRWPAGAPSPDAWLRAAEVMHVGKATSFGFGRLCCKVETS